MATGSNAMPLKLHQNTNILDKSFHEQNTRSYVMSAVLDRHGFAVCIYAPAKNKVIGLITQPFKEVENEAEISTQLDDILNTFPWLSFPFLKVCLLYRNKLNTLIPLPLFDKKNAALYLEFNHPRPKENRVVFDQVKHSDAVNVYSLPETVIEKVKTTWPNVVLKHASTSLIEGLNVLVKNKSNDNNLFLNVAENSFELVYFKENKLHFYNQFAFHTKEDFVYFLLSTIEQLELNPESVDLLLSGRIDQSDALYEIVFRYIRNVSFVQRNESFLYAYILDEIKSHRHFVLFNSLPCE
jgi:hypothetical protein